MKKLFTTVVALVLAFSMLVTLTACGGGNNGGDHTHVFDQKNPANKYLDTVATCQTPATYFKSCTCGEKGSETFEYGSADLTNHDYIDHVCACGDLEDFSNDLAYEINEDGESWTLTGRGYFVDTDIIVPTKHENLPVTAVANEAFKGSDITSIKLGKNVVSIGYGAFQNCTALTRVELGSFTESIGGQAFSSCPLLTKIVIPSTVTEMESTVFVGWQSTSTIYCRISAKPNSWDAGWLNQCNAQVEWGYKGN